MHRDHPKYSLCTIFSTEIPVSLQPTELSFHEAKIPWQAHLKCTTCNLGKIKYRVLVRMVCVTVLGFISKMKIYSTKGQNLEDTDSSLLERNLGQNHHDYQATFIIIWDQLKHCWQEGESCGTVMTSKGHSTWPRTWSQPQENRAVSVPEERWCKSPSVDRQKTCANEKDDPWCNCSEHRKERQNTLLNKVTSHCFSVQ